MKLTVSTPLAVALEADDVRHLRAEDATGAFGILPGHADFLTALSASVIRWRHDHGPEHYMAVRGGVLEVSGGIMIAIATPEAVAGDDLGRLEAEALARFRQQAADEQTARTDAQRLYLAALRQIIRYVRGQSASSHSGSLTSADSDFGLAG
jgi:F-type H+-transporting ATPase subunit epsilon